ncbi:unnamed protein product [Camellia sinensis]
MGNMHIKGEAIMEEANNDSTDRISLLPDHIIQHISSFLLLEDAVATRVLSETWQCTTPVQDLSFRNPCSFINKQIDNVNNGSPLGTRGIRSKLFLDFVDQSLKGI